LEYGDVLQGDRFRPVFDPVEITEVVIAVVAPDQRVLGFLMLGLLAFEPPLRVVSRRGCEARPDDAEFLVYSRSHAPRGNAYDS